MADVRCAECTPRTEDWKMLPWRNIQRNVFRLQQRIYQAERRGDHKQVHNLQRLLLHSWSARCLAVRQVTQDNRGKRTPGVDGVANLTPKQRMALVEELRDVWNWQADPIRRTYIAKRGSTELRGLGIPTMRERAMQALARLALEPKWEAKFEPNSYGFRPGRRLVRIKPPFFLKFTDIILTSRAPWPSKMCHTCKLFSGGNSVLIPSILAP